MRRLSLCLVATCATAFAQPALAPAAIARASARVPSVAPFGGHETALLGVRPSAAAEALLRAANAEPLARQLGIWRLSSARTPAVARALRRAGALRYIEPDRPQAGQSHHLTAGDPLAVPAIGWHLYRIGADRVEPPGPGVSVSIVDSGLDTSHMEFVSRPDTVLLNAQPARTWEMSDLYHGTSVSSVAVAPADGLGTVGVYPQAILRTYAVQAVFDAPLTGDVVRGIVRAASAGRTVINLSLSGPTFSRSEYEAIIGATHQGALVVAAAGNEFKQGSPVSYPAALPHVLSVASTGTTDAPSAFSTRSTALDIAAPGEAIPVQHPSDPAVWKTVSGTSFSSPIVAAAAAWIWTVRPELDAGQVAELLRSSARDVWTAGFDDRTGYGLLDLPAALDPARVAPPADVQEPNDDIDQIAPGRLFATGRAPLTTRTKRSARIQATLDASEDPSDVYRLVIPARQTLTATVTGSTNIGTILWGSSARSVFAKGKTATRTRLAGSDRAGKRAERVVYRNTTRASMTVYLDVWFARGAARRATYTASISSR